MSKKYPLTGALCIGYPCPFCGSQNLVATSEQVMEDLCEMWIECGDCGEDPYESGERVETVMGFDKRLLKSCGEVWMGAVQRVEALRRVSDRTESPQPVSGEDLEGERDGESSSRDAQTQRQH